jgi:hypothetical protein
MKAEVVALSLVWPSVQSWSASNWAAAPYVISPTTWSGNRGTNNAATRRGLQPLRAESSTLEHSHVMSTVERARTVAATCGSGTLCTSCKNQEGHSFGSHVDYVLDAKGWPVLLLNDQALHTGNIQVSLFFSSRHYCRFCSMRGSTLMPCRAAALRCARAPLVRSITGLRCSHKCRPRRGKANHPRPWLVSPSWAR